VRKTFALSLLVGAISFGLALFCPIGTGKHVHSSESNFLPLSYEQIMGVVESMNPVQAKAYIRTLTGRRVTWQGWVHRVYKFRPFVGKEVRGYSVYMDMRGITGSLELSDPWEVELKIPENAPLDVRYLREDQSVIFSGTIEITRFVINSKHAKVTLRDITATPIDKGQPESPAAQGVAYRVLIPTSVYREPSEDSREILRLGTGTEVSVADVRGDWLRIHSRYGRPPGFIKKDTAAPVRSQ